MSGIGEPETRERNRPFSLTCPKHPFTRLLSPLKIHDCLFLLDNLLLPNPFCFPLPHTRFPLSFAPPSLSPNSNDLSEDSNSKAWDFDVWRTRKEFASSIFRIFKRTVRIDREGWSKAVVKVTKDVLSGLRINCRRLLVDYEFKGEVSTLWRHHESS